MKKLTLHLLLLCLPMMAYSQSTYSLLFDTSVAYVAVDSNVVLEADNHAVTVVVWIKPMPQPDQGSLIWCNRGANLTLGNIYYSFGLESNMAIYFKYSDGSNTVIYRTDSNLVTNNVWHNLIVTIPENRTSPVVSLDGVLRTVSKDTPQPAGTIDPVAITDGDKFFIAGNGYPVNSYRGWIYGVSVWDRILTNYEMFCYSNELPNGNESGLVAFWDFNEGTGTTITDITPNAVMGTFVGDVVFSSDIPILIDCNTGLEDYLSSMIAVFPNPTNDVITFDFQTIGEGSITITDLNGKILKIMPINNTQTLSISIFDLIPGIYIADITFDDQRIVKKIIMQH